MNDLVRITFDGGDDFVIIYTGPCLRAAIKLSVTGMNILSYAAPTPQKCRPGDI